jgi:streptogramin lyase
MTDAVRLLLGSVVGLLAALLLPAPASAAITEFPIPTAASDPFGITPGPDGALWFTEEDGNKIGRITSGPVPSAFKNAASFCRAQRGFLGDSAFRQRYGTNGNGANAFGKCVSQSH